MNDFVLALLVAQAVVLAASVKVQMDVRRERKERDALLARRALRDAEVELGEIQPQGAWFL